MDEIGTVKVTLVNGDVVEFETKGNFKVANDLLNFIYDQPEEIHMFPIANILHIFICSKQITSEVK